MQLFLVISWECLVFYDKPLLSSDNLFSFREGQDVFCVLVEISLYIPFSNFLTCQRMSFELEAKKNRVRSCTCLSPINTKTIFSLSLWFVRLDGFTNPKRRKFLTFTFLPNPLPMQPISYLITENRTQIGQRRNNSIFRKRDLVSQHF